MHSTVMYYNYCNFFFHLDDLYKIFSLSLCSGIGWFSRNQNESFVLSKTCLSSYFSVSVFELLNYYFLFLSKVICLIISLSGLADIECHTCGIVGDVANLMTCCTCNAHHHGTCVGLAQLPGKLFSLMKYFVSIVVSRLFTHFKTFFRCKGWMEL